MTRKEFVDGYRHRFGGLVLDALASGLHGPELSMRLRSVLQTIDTVLAEAYDKLIPPEMLPVRGAINGAPEAVKAALKKGT